MLRCVLSMFSRVYMVAMGEMRMMRGGFMVSIQVMTGGFAMVARSLLVMVRCLVVVVRCFM